MAQYGPAGGTEAVCELPWDDMDPQVTAIIKNLCLAAQDAGVSNKKKI